MWVKFLTRALSRCTIEMSNDRLEIHMKRIDFSEKAFRLSIEDKKTKIDSSMKVKYNINSSNRIINTTIDADPAREKIHSKLYL